MRIVRSNTHHIGFTGTRREPSKRQQYRLYDVLSTLGGLVVFHHGMCPQGGDIMFHRLVSDLWTRPQIVGHPCNLEGQDWPDDLNNFVDVYDEEPPLDRNKVIVAKTPYLLIGMPGTNKEAQRSGTWATIRYRRSAGTPYTLIFPNGRVELFGSVAA